MTKLKRTVHSIAKHSIVQHSTAMVNLQELSLTQITHCSMRAIGSPALVLCLVKSVGIL